MSANARVVDTPKKSVPRSTNTTAKPLAPMPKGGPETSVAQPIDQSQSHWNCSEMMNPEEREQLANIHVRKLRILVEELEHMILNDRYQAASKALPTLNLEVNLLAGHVTRLIP